MVKPIGQPNGTEPRDLATEQRILEAAHRVFVRRGTAGARMQEIADEAGVNKALLHYYFRSKDRLAAAVFAQVARALFIPLAALLTSDLPLEEKAVRVIEHELEHVSRSPFLPGYLIAEMSHFPERLPEMLAAATGLRPSDVAGRIRGTLGRQIEEAVAAGRMRPIAPEQFLVSLVSLCIFPFAARPLLSTLLGLDAAAFDDFIARRREELPEFFLRAIRP